MFSRLTDSGCPESFYAFVAAGDDKHFDECRWILSEEVVFDGFELIIGDDESLVDDPFFVHGTTLNDCLIEALQQYVVDGVYLLSSAVVTLHELFDRKLIAVPETQLLREFLLMFKK